MVATGAERLRELRLRHGVELARRATALSMAAASDAAGAGSYRWAELGQHRHASAAYACERHRRAAGVVWRRRSAGAGADRRRAGELPLHGAAAVARAGAEQARAKRRRADAVWRRLQRDSGCRNRC